MSQLPTDPILAALPSDSVIGVYQQDQLSTAIEIAHFQRLKLRTFG
jgi:hypothetical protein